MKGVDFTGKWDPHFVSGRIVQSLSEGQDILHVSYSSVRARGSTTHCVGRQISVSKRFCVC